MSKKVVDALAAMRTHLSKAAAAADLLENALCEQTAARILEDMQIKAHLERVEGDAPKAPH